MEGSEQAIRYVALAVGGGIVLAYGCVSRQPWLIFVGLAVGLAGASGAFWWGWHNH